MNEKWEKILDSEVFRSVLIGVSFAGGIVFAILAIMALIAAIDLSPWWLAAFVIGGLLSGVCFGLGVYSTDECW